MGQYAAYPAYKDSGIPWLGEIPGEWDTGLVKRYFDVELGKMLNRSVSTEDGVLKPYLRAANIHWGRILVDDVNEMEFTPNQLPRYRLAYGDLLVTEGGVTVGRSALWRDEIDECYYQNSINRVRPNSAALAIPEFLYYWMYFTKTNGYIDLAANIATFGHLTQEKLQALPLIIPPLPEQQAIARFLDHKTAQIDALIAKKEALLARLAEKRTALITRAVTQGLDPSVPRKDSGVAWLGEIPAHWEAWPLRRFTELVQTGPFGSQLHSHEYVENGFPVVNPANIIDGDVVPNYQMTVDEETRQRLSRHILQPGDIVLGRRGELGRASYVSEREAGWLCGTGSMLIRLADSRLRADFLAQYIRLPLVKGYLTVESVGSTMDNLNADIIKGMMVILPPLEEQMQIVEYLSGAVESINQQQSKIQQAINTLKEYRTALITHAVTGKIDVRHVALAEPETAEVQYA